MHWPSWTLRVGLENLFPTMHRNRHDWTALPVVNQWVLGSHWAVLGELDRDYGRQQMSHEGLLVEDTHIVGG